MEVELAEVELVLALEGAAVDDGAPDVAGAEVPQPEVMIMRPARTSTWRTRTIPTFARDDQCSLL